MKNTRYVKVQVSFVLCYDEPLDGIPAEMRNVNQFLTGGIQEAFIDSTRHNRESIYLCPYAKLNASLIHAPRGLPQALAQTQDGRQTSATRSESQAEPKTDTSEKAPAKKRKARK